MQIMERFNAEGIDFAFPSQTMYLAGDNKRPLNLGQQLVASKPPAKSSEKPGFSKEHPTSVAPSADASIEQELLPGGSGDEN